MIRTNNNNLNKYRLKYCYHFFKETHKKISNMKNEIE